MNVREFTKWRLAAADRGVSRAAFPEISRCFLKTDRLCAFWRRKFKVSVRTVIYYQAGFTECGGNDDGTTER